MSWRASGYGEKKAAIVGAMRRQRSEKLPNRSIGDWAKSFDCTPSYVARLARMLGYVSFFTVGPRKLMRGKFTVLARGKNITAMIPMMALRAAGLEKERRLQFRVNEASQQIIVEPTEEPDASSPQ